MLEESKIDIINKNLEKKIYKINSMIKPYHPEDEDEEDSVFTGSFLK